MAPYAIESLNMLGIKSQRSFSYPSIVQDKDMRSSELIVALYKAEHELMIKKRFPDLTKNVIYWDIPDIDNMSALDATRAIERNVLDLIETLRENNK
jgi:protein-tyrosine-phosphatase